MSEIVVGTIAQQIIGAVVGSAVLGTDESWIKFLSGIGAIVLTFLAGAELDPVVFRLKWKEAAAVGLASFFFPFLGCAAAAHYLLNWEVMPSWLAGVAMSTTSVAVVYAVMIEFGFNTTEYGKTVLAACFVTDLGTVVALGLIFSPFTMKTLIFLGAGAVVFGILPWATPRFFRLYGGRPSELETKFLLLCLFGMGALASWADSEAVLPAYLIGMALAGTVGKDHALVRRLRTLTFGLLTPFYFIRAGSFVSVPALITAPAAFIFFLVIKIVTKVVGVYPVTKAFGSPSTEAMYTTLLMSTGLTFGTISSLFGLSHGIINQGQYSALVAAVIGSAVMPTIIANAFYLPRHLLPDVSMQQAEEEPVRPLRPATRRAE
ncbi:cation:proton antiporter [Bradyrhizobium sp. ISRA435]|nr:cation:proton antiporter [Bradyrhizobium sp. ISRA435]